MPSSSISVTQEQLSNQIFEIIHQILPAKRLSDNIDEAFTHLHNIFNEEIPNLQERMHKLETTVEIIERRLTAVEENVKSHKADTKILTHDLSKRLDRVQNVVVTSSIIDESVGQKSTSSSSGLKR